MAVSEPLAFLLLAAYLLLPAVAIVDLVRRTSRWGPFETLTAVVVVVGGPIAAAVVLLLGRTRKPRTEPKRRPNPLYPYVPDLEAPYVPRLTRDYDPVELVRYALTDLKDEWSDRALAWLEQGLPATGLRRELETVEREPLRPASQRMRAAALLRALDRDPK